MYTLPCGAITMLGGSVNSAGGLPGTPVVPRVNKTFPSGLNLTTMWPFFSPGYFAASRWLGLRWSATQMLPSRSAYTLCGNRNMPAPQLRTRLPFLSNFMTGATADPAQLSYWNGEAPGGVSGFDPHRLPPPTAPPPRVA